ncbi:hypothetical protein ACFROC_30945 [Nocardia tengchongensis]|uniref:hypothetical protein n=1 Tax=Nocardia tengchongensis TaxID=2055889 RepID=UPI003696B0AA
MKSALTHRVSTVLATAVASAALATGAATAAPATLEPAAPTAEPAATSIAGTCNTGSSAPLAALQNGSGGNLAAFAWPLENALTCLTSGSAATPALAPIAGLQPPFQTGSAALDAAESIFITGSSAASTAFTSGSAGANVIGQILCKLEGGTWDTTIPGCTLKGGFEPSALTVDSIPGS